MKFCFVLLFLSISRTSLNQTDTPPVQNIQPTPSADSIDPNQITPRNLKIKKLSKIEEKKLKKQMGELMPLLYQNDKETYAKMKDMTFKQKERFLQFLSASDFFNSKYGLMTLVGTGVVLSLTIPRLIQHFTFLNLERRFQNKERLLRRSKERKSRELGDLERRVDDLLDQIQKLKDMSNSRLMELNDFADVAISFKNK